MSTITIVCIALMGILLFLLGANVTRHRTSVARTAATRLRPTRRDPLLIAVRAHGNAAEYIPTMIVLLLVCSALSDSWWVEALAVAAVVVRTSARRRHAHGQDPRHARPAPRLSAP